MKAVILAGGMGSRISEESDLKPKPLIEIGGKPILWHLMKIYLSHGVNEFIVCCGYKGYMIKEYFSNYSLHQSDVTFDMKKKSIEIRENNTEPWIVTLVDTGENTMTGGRLKRVKEYVKNDECFCFTYGDGLGNVDISALISFHKKNNKKVTITATKPPGRYGVLKIADNNIVESFQEKPDGDGSWINGGFFVLKPSIFDFIENDNSIWEDQALNHLTSQGETIAFKHRGFWQPMDTLRDKKKLNDLWDKGKAPWKIWK